MPNSINFILRGHDRASWSWRSMKAEPGDEGLLTPGRDVRERGQAGVDLPEPECETLNSRQLEHDGGDAVLQPRHSSPVNFDDWWPGSFPFSKWLSSRLSRTGRDRQQTGDIWCEHRTRESTGCVLKICKIDVYFRWKLLTNGRGQFSSICALTECFLFFLWCFPAFVSLWNFCGKCSSSSLL